MRRARGVRSCGTIHDRKGEKRDCAPLADGFGMIFSLGMARRRVVVVGGRGGIVRARA